MSKDNTYSNKIRPKTKIQDKKNKKHIFLGLGRAGEAVMKTQGATVPPSGDGVPSHPLMSKPVVSIGAAIRILWESLKRKKKTNEAQASSPTD